MWSLFDLSSGEASWRGQGDSVSAWEIKWLAAVVIHFYKDLLSALDPPSGVWGSGQEGIMTLIGSSRFFFNSQDIGTYRDVKFWEDFCHPLW